MTVETSRQIPRVLSIAGTDPTGGAGIQADLKSIAANGGYGMAAVTSLVAQNTRGVRAIHTPPAGFLEEQLNAVSDDVTIDAVKIGMMADSTTVEVVETWLDAIRPPIAVLDPVLIATSGHRLVEATTLAALRRLLAHVDLITPNLFELGALLGEDPAVEWTNALGQAHRLSDRYGVRVLAKGGHLLGPESPDALIDASGRLGAGRQLVESTIARVATCNTHGTGCSLSSGLATNQARLGDWTAALLATKTWLTDSLRHADDLDVGTGNGPINHFHRLWNGAGQDS